MLCTPCVSGRTHYALQCVLRICRITRCASHSSHPTLPLSPQTLHSVPTVSGLTIGYAYVCVRKRTRQPSCCNRQRGHTTERTEDCGSLGAMERRRLPMVHADS